MTKDLLRHQMICRPGPGGLMARVAVPPTRRKRMVKKRMRRCLDKIVREQLE